MSKIIKQYTINSSYYDKDTKKFNEKEIDIIKEGCEEKLNDLFYDMENAALFYSLGSKKNILPYIFKKEIYPKAVEPIEFTFDESHISSTDAD